MRQLHVRVPASERSSVEAVLEDLDFEYVTSTGGSDDDGDDGDDDGDGDVHFFFPLPTAAVSDVLDGLDDADIDSDAYTVVTKGEFAHTGEFSELQREYNNETPTLSRAELGAKIQESRWPRLMYYGGSVLSVLAATCGLLLDQPALVIGAMVIAPQVSAALAAPAAAIDGKWDVFRGSVKEQVLGLVLAILVATPFALALRRTGFVPPAVEVTSIELVGVRLAPSLLSTVGATVAGIVGAYGYSTEQSVSLIGVMIAAAIVPAAGGVGLGLAWGEQAYAVGSLLLLAVNVLAINIGAFVAFLLLGYEPPWLFGKQSLGDSVPDADVRRVYATILLVTVATVATGALTASQVGFSHQTKGAVQGTMSSPAYADLEMTGVTTEYGGLGAPSGPTSVTVTVSGPSGTPPDDLASDLESEIERRTDRDVAVAVDYRSSWTTNASSG